MVLKNYQNSLGYEEPIADAVADLALDANGDPVRALLKRAATGDLTAQELGESLLCLMESKRELVVDSIKDEAGDYFERTYSAEVDKHSEPLGVA